MPSSENQKIIVVGLGNDLISDDGAGVYCARELKDRLGDIENISIIEVDRAGFRFLEILHGFDIAFLVDAVWTGGEPGTVKELSFDDFGGSMRLTGQHDMNIVTAIEFGKKIGYDMPETVRIWGIEAKDLTTIREECTEEVMKGVLKAADIIEREIRLLFQ